MSSRYNILDLKTVFLLVMGVILMGCQDTIPNRGLISDSSIVPGGGTTGSTGGGVPPVLRPTSSIKFKSDFCGCKDSVPVTLGNCTTICSTKKTSGAGLLFMNFTVGDNISLNSKLQNVNGWCNNPIEGEASNPRCVVKAKDDLNNEIILDVESGTTLNSLKVNIDTLADDKAYVITLVETSSGSKSDSVQVIKFTKDLVLSTLGPLRNAPISQYSCLYRPQFTGGEENSAIFYDIATRIHRYFIPRLPPNPMPYGSDLVCHDFQNPLYTAIDDLIYPRFENIPGVFNLWDTTDPRFYDNNGNENLDVNDIIIQKAKNFGYTTISPTQSYFQLFPVPQPIASTSTTAPPEETPQSMGYYMSPWIDQTTFRSFCLNSTHYNSSNPLYKAFRDILGVDMEGIYVGIKEAESVFDSQGNVVEVPSDQIFVRETDLKKVWFYLRNNTIPTAPTETNVAGVAVYFYYPFNFNAPYIRSSTQRRYQLKGALDVANVPQGGNNTSGVRTNYPPHDRKIGCIPKF